jgi:hypothetical protein
MTMADMRRLTLLLAAPLACALLAAPRAGAQVEEQARALLADSKPAQAIPLLKAAIEQEPLAKSPRLLLARAYLDDGNDFWALRTLASAAELHPEDCNLMLWQAWIGIKQGALDQARELLQTPCATWPPVEARRSLLLAMVEQSASAKDAAQARLDQARGARFAFPEDRHAIARMQSQLDPGFLAPFSGRFDLAMGATSNARAGSPVDPESHGNGAASLAVVAAGTMRFVSPNRSWARLSLEAEARGAGYQADAGRDLSYLLLGGRSGLLLSAWGKRALLGYRYESLLLAGGDRYEKGPLWFNDAHRGEWELELLPALTLFGGAGRRGFREIGRTRTELDGGIGGGFPIGPRMHLLAALSGRFHDAKNDAYDQRGISLLLSADVRGPRRWSGRVGLLASGDDYPRSTGYFDPAAPATARRDLVLRLSTSVFLPPLDNRIKLGLTYELAVRQSTAAPYDYTDHRVLAKLIWTFTSDPWLPHPATPVGHVPLDYGLAAGEVAERVQDLLRQGEAAQRSTSCRE